MPELDEKFSQKAIGMSIDRAVLSFSRAGDIEDANLMAVEPVEHIIRIVRAIDVCAVAPLKLIAVIWLAQCFALFDGQGGAAGWLIAADN